MRITPVRVARREGTLADLPRCARARWSGRAGLVLVLRDEEGRTGLGEASPLPGFSPDTIERCARALEELRPTSLPDPPAADSILPWLAEATRAVGGNAPAARFALETALADLAARREGVPLSERLAGRSIERPVPLAALVSGDTPAAILDRIRRARARGIETVKLKIGMAGLFEEEIETLRLARSEFGDAIALRLDANGAWGLEEAKDRLQALAPFEPEFVEQPVPAHLLLELGDSPVPIAADETLALPGAAERLDLVPACRVFVLKPMVLGGLTAALHIAGIAKRRRCGVVVGHLFDGPVALAAYAELALALRPAPLACGIDRHAGLRIWPEVAIAQIGDRLARPSGRPGLGIDGMEEIA